MKIYYGSLKGKAKHRFLLLHYEKTANNIWKTYTKDKAKNVFNQYEIFRV